MRDVTADHMRRFLSMVACFGFWFFLPNTQYRIGPIGLSECFGVLAILVVAAGGRVKLTVETVAALFVHGVLTTFTFFWASTSGANMSAELRDVVAVSYSLAVAIAVIYLMRTHVSALRASVGAIALILLVHFVILLLSVTGFEVANVWLVDVDDVAPVIDLLQDPTSLIPRFTGFSLNPNQLAFFILFSLFFLLANRNLFASKRYKVLCALLALIAVLLLVATQSDAGMLALVSGIALYAIASLVRRGGAPSALTGYIVFMVAGVVVSSAWEWGVGDDAGGQRLPLWISAIDIINESGGLGLGYGAHIPTEFGPYEAHSLVFDLALNGGLFGMFFFVLVLVHYARTLLIGKCFMLAVLAGSALVFCLTYSPMRNPVFWISVFAPFYLSGCRTRRVLGEYR